MLYDTVLPGVVPPPRYACRSCGTGYNSADKDRQNLLRALSGEAEELRTFLKRYPEEVPHYPSTCRLKDVPTALIVNCEDEREALLWEEQVREKLK
ncbi:hypothetical protein ACWGQ5_13250 [Streptomyces sp. NPDC055722]